MKKIIIYFILISQFAISANSYALNTDLFNMPQPPVSTIVWDGRLLEINGIQATATHLRVEDMNVAELIDFYNSNLRQRGWQPQTDAYFTEHHVLTFIKEDKFFYVAILKPFAEAPADVYLCVSPAELRICESVSKYILKNNLVEDTPGKDIDIVPRYPVSRRRLSVIAPEEGNILLYEAEGAPADIAKFYRQNLKAYGWKEEPAISNAQKLVPQLKDNPVLVFYRGEDILLINITAAPKEAEAQTGNAIRSFIIISRNMLDELANVP